jgi:DNA-binding Xre family transcriptional regulator
MESAPGCGQPRDLEASELQWMLAERGLVISAGKMSGLWSGNPNVVKLHDLDVICAVLGCGVDELLIPEPDTVAQPTPAAENKTVTVGQARTVTPRARTGRSMPPR